jgi:hypothetical protein
MTKIYICYFGQTYECAKPFSTFEKALTEARESVGAYRFNTIAEYTFIDGEYVETNEHKITKTSFNPTIIQGGK